MKTAALCYNDARTVANKVVQMLGVFCEEIVTAGSLRRGEAVCHDVELVCVPRMVPRQGRALFADVEPEMVSALDRFVKALSETRGDLVLDPETKRNGPRYKRFLAFQTVPVDLFIVAPPAEWGAILAIRTGDAEFSHLLVTKQAQGGAMPDDLDQRDGALWRGFTKVPTPTEESYFQALGLDMISPARRSGERLRQILTSRKKA